MLQMGRNLLKDTNRDKKIYCFIAGAKGFQGYGGYETFVDKLTEYHAKDPDICYYVACRSHEPGDCLPDGETKQINDRLFRYHNAFGVRIPVPDIGSAQAILYDIRALHTFCRMIRKKRPENVVVYVLACRIGPFMGYFRRRIHRLGGTLVINPDGHEWKRGKWNRLIQAYWKISEGMMVRQADLVICDSRNIESYIKETYRKVSPKTEYIAYGCDTEPSGVPDNDPDYQSWLAAHQLTSGEYYLIVGRFVPENNFETIIREFMRSKTEKRLAVITTPNDALFRSLEEKLHFQQDPRIRFVGTVYDQRLLKKIRENAFGYIHGHEVGGTNPSLLEALGYTRLNLLLDVGFNREVAEDSALYWTKEAGDLCRLLEQAENLTGEQLDSCGAAAKEQIRTRFSWPFIAGRYKEILSKAVKR